MPPIGMLLGGVDFLDLFLSLSGKAYESLAAAKAAGALTLDYGVFLNTLINFLLIAGAVFLFIVKPVNRMKTAPPPRGHRPRKTPVLSCDNVDQGHALWSLHV